MIALVSIMVQCAYRASKAVWRVEADGNLNARCWYAPPVLAHGSAATDDVAKAAVIVVVQRKNMSPGTA